MGMSGAHLILVSILANLKERALKKSALCQTALSHGPMAVWAALVG